MSNKEKIIKWIDFLGEYTAYFYVFAIFIASKLNLKIRYILEVLFVLKIILDYQNIKIKGKKIYYVYGIILVIGILFNYLASGNKAEAIHTFIGRNIRFYHGLMILIFINTKEKLIKMTNVILAGIAFLGIGIWQKYGYVKLDIHRLRGIIVLGAMFSMIYFVENIKKIGEKFLYKELLLSFIATIAGLLGIAYSDSRMGFLVIIGTAIAYISYNLLQKFSIKKLIISFFIAIISLGVFYKTMPSLFEKEVKTSFETKHNFSNEARLIMWEGCWNAFKSSPIIGKGSLLTDVGPFIKKVGENTTRGKSLQTAFKNDMFLEGHSIYFNLLSQVGMLTLVYLYLFFILIPQNFLKTDKNPVAVASFFGILSFLMYGMTWSVWSFYGLVQTLFQIYLGILLSNLKEENIN